jgi:hypothetical protein
MQASRHQQQLTPSTIASLNKGGKIKGSTHLKKNDKNKIK